MSLKRVMIYLSISLLLLGFLTFSLWRKSHRETALAPVNYSSTVKNLPSNQSGILQDSKRDSGKSNELPLHDGPVALESLPAGRVNPFARLPQEDLLNDELPEPEPGTKRQPAVITVPTVPKPAMKPSGNIRGILLGTNPAAYVETEDGSLRKVRIGDTWSGGKIVSITKNSIIIQRGSDTITQKLGE